MELPPDSPGDYILQPPVFHPILPYFTTIFSGLTPGKMVLVQGTIPVEAERFQVDFQRGCSLQPRADIGVHFNPRFHARPHVVCNALSDSRWMEETRFPNLPLKGGDSFQLLFLFEQDHVQVSINGQHCLQYPFGLPLVQMNTLGVSGDVVVKSIAFLANNPFDASRTGYPMAPRLFTSSTSLAVPLSRQLPRSLQPGDTLTVRGLVHEDPKEFHISLKKDPSHTTLSFRVCFTDKTVGWSSSSLQSPELGKMLGTGFPFYPQRYFELLLRVCTEDHLKLALNGTPLGKQHLPPLATSPVTELAIDGDLTLYDVLLC
ncbi:galectin-12 isoform X2 [Hemicordylus capensis]|uniref:galectin-12 isoform X2 n=1 Tax=Hemicordylus capensis TaxID=884348 RepID=UPI00230407C3|nr:galectin-12 isoform X2 [Hemicordylus capensis]